MCDKRDAAQAEAVRDFVEKYFLSFMPLDRILTSLGCLRNCRWNKHTLREFSTKADWSENGSFGAIRVFTTQSFIPFEKEVPIYGLNNLVADIGGSLGMLLGASILGLYDQCQNVRARIMATKKNFLLLLKKYWSDTK